MTQEIVKQDTVKAEALENINEIGGYKLEIETGVEAKAKETFIAWCKFTTLKLDSKGHLTSTQLKEGDEIDATQVPLVWINDAIAKRHLISKKDKDSLNQDQLRKKGYSVQ